MNVHDSVVIKVSTPFTETLSIDTIIVHTLGLETLNVPLWKLS
jgi:hypothetical protein